VARLGEEATPPLPAPRPLRRLLGFARLPDHALIVVARVIDTDEEFRLRVAIAAEEADIGRAGFVYVVRPDGWESELAALTEEAQAAASTVAAAEAAEQDERHAERQARRQARNAESARQQAERALADARAALETERKLHRDTQSRLAAALRKPEAAQVPPVLAAPPVPPVPPPPVPAPAPAVEAQVAAQVAAISAARDAVRQASAALAGAEAALAKAVAALQPAPPKPRPPAAPPRPTRRQPAPLPPAVFDDSAEAAEHLVRVPRVIILVDGYNVGFLAWPQLAVQDIRQRLVDALGELAARTTAEFLVVFDGADGNEQIAKLGSMRGRVRVRFSEPEEEADDVIIGLAATLPADRPVVVATNDRRVQDAVRRLGCRTVSSGQFLGVLRRAVRG
jgi:predicted RNA-binding protein with PIN domain